jgi:hypothetical protein
MIGETNAAHDMELTEVQDRNATAAAHRHASSERCLTRLCFFLLEGLFSQIEIEPKK